MSQCLVIKYTLLLWAYAAVCNVQQSSCTLGGSYSFLLQLIFPLFTARAAQTQKCFALEWLPHAHFNVHIYLLSITCRVFFWFVFTVSHLLPFQRKTKKETIPLTAIAPCTAVGFIGAIRREGQTLRLLLAPSLTSLRFTSHTAAPPSTKPFSRSPPFSCSCLTPSSSLLPSLWATCVSVCARVLPQLTGRIYKVLWTRIPDDFYLPICHICATVQNRIPLLSVQHLDGISNPLELMSSRRGTKQAVSGFPSPQFW